MPTTPTHTPTPWRQSEINPNYLLDDAKGEIIAEARPHYVDKKSKENIEFIVRAVNMHQILIDTVKSLRDGFEQELSGDTCANIDSILAKAEGK